VAWSMLSSHPPKSWWSNSGVLNHGSDSVSLSSLEDPKCNFTVNIITLPENSKFLYKIIRWATLNSKTHYDMLCVQCLAHSMVFSALNIYGDQQ
jgi:hypothetical protein